MTSTSLFQHSSCTLTCILSTWSRLELTWCLKCTPNNPQMNFGDTHSSKNPTKIHVLFQLHSFSSLRVCPRFRVISLASCRQIVSRCMDCVLEEHCATRPDVSPKNVRGFTSTPIPWSMNSKILRQWTCRKGKSNLA